MKRHPQEYRKENLKEIMHKPLKIGIGNTKSDEITKVIEGVITECTLAASLPHLPGTAQILTADGNIIRKNFFEIKSIDIL
jgi:hypothetical protein